MFKALVPIRYVRGDATAPIGNGFGIIAHVCNDVGAWGKGFVLALSRRWPEPAQVYKQWHRERDANDFGLGAVQFVRVGEEICVANMIAQHGIRPSQGVPPIRYEALDHCLETVAKKASELGASIHMPRIGCGLAGGEWGRIEPIIVQRLCEQDIPVTVYDLE
jgi:O-acetyl-ADP-ribose deacetylase (regulator of RNase III)